MLARRACITLSPCALLDPGGTSNARSLATSLLALLLQRSGERGSSWSKSGVAAPLPRMRLAALQTHMPDGASAPETNGRMHPGTVA